MQRSVLIIICLFSGTFCFSQGKTWIGIEASFAVDRYEIIDNYGALLKPKVVSPLAGINIRREIGNNAFLETGFLYKSFDEGTAFKGNFGYSQSTGFNAWIIPVRLGAIIHLNKKTNLVPVIGYSVAFNSDYAYDTGGSTGSGSMSNSTTSINYSYDVTYPERRFGVLQTGLGLQFILFKKLDLTAGANYYTGFKKVLWQHYHYSVNGGAQQEADTFTNGGFFSGGIAFRYPISNLWHKK
jgi:hypothetical protein